MTLLNKTCSCDAYLDDDWEYCPYCGIELEHVPENPYEYQTAYLGPMNTDFVPTALKEGWEIVSEEFQNGNRMFEFKRLKLRG